MARTYKLFSTAVIHELLDAEVIIADLDSGAYYSMRDSAAPIWQLMVAGHSLESIASQAAKRYACAPRDLPALLERFASRLCEERLLAADEASEGPGTPPAGLAWPQAWDAPQLEKYEEMKDLLMLDPIHEVDEQGWPHRPAP